MTRLRLSSHSFRRVGDCRGALGRGAATLRRSDALRTIVLLLLAYTTPPIRGGEEDAATGELYDIVRRPTFPSLSRRGGAREPLTPRETESQTPPGTTSAFRRTHTGPGSEARRDPSAARGRRGQSSQSAHRWNPRRACARIGSPGSGLRFEAVPHAKVRARRRRQIVRLELQDLAPGERRRGGGAAASMDLPGPEPGLHQDPKSHRASAPDKTVRAVRRASSSRLQQAMRREAFTSGSPLYGIEAAGVRASDKSSATGLNPETPSRNPSAELPRKEGM